MPSLLERIEAIPALESSANSELATLIAAGLRKSEAVTAEKLTSNPKVVAAANTLLGKHMTAQDAEAEAQTALGDFFGAITEAVLNHYDAGAGSDLAADLSATTPEAPAVQDGTTPAEPTA